MQKSAKVTIAVYWGINSLWKGLFLTLTPTGHHAFVCKASHILFHRINGIIARQFQSCTRKNTSIRVIFCFCSTGCASAYQDVGYLVGDSVTCKQICINKLLVKHKRPCYNISTSLPQIDLCAHMTSMWTIQKKPGRTQTISLQKYRRTITRFRRQLVFIRLWTLKTFSMHWYQVRFWREKGSNATKIIKLWHRCSVTVSAR